MLWSLLSQCVSLSGDFECLQGKHKSRLMTIRVRILLLLASVSFLVNFVIFFLICDYSHFLEFQIVRVTFRLQKFNLFSPSRVMYNTFYLVTFIFRVHQTFIFLPFLHMIRKSSSSLLPYQVVLSLDM